MEASSCRGNSEAHFQSLVNKKLVKANTGVSKLTLRTILLLPKEKSTTMMANADCQLNKI